MSRVMAVRIFDVKRCVCSRLGLIPIRGLPKGLLRGLPRGLSRGFSCVTLASDLHVWRVTRRADIVLSSRVLPLQKGGGGRPEAYFIFDVFDWLIEDSMGFSTLV